MFKTKIFLLFLHLLLNLTINIASLILPTLSEKKVLSRTLKGSSAQRSAGTFKGTRLNPLEMVLSGTLPKEP